LPDVPVTPVTSITPSPDKPIPVRRVHWRAGVRIIPSLFPPIDLFERVARPDHLDAVQAIESAFNPRLRDATGDLALVPRGERVVGPGAGYIMAAFTHVSPDGSRFSNGTYGVFYAAQREPTAIAETRFHRERFMRATQEPRAELDMRVLSVTVKASLHDLRGMRPILPEIYRLDDYSESQILGVFKPRALSHCRERKHLRYIWDGARITDVLEIKRLLAPRP
jgi:hypothetical protein